FVGAALKVLANVLPPVISWIKQ
uniref:Melittin-related peptide FQ-22-1 n=1 Tax=Rana arvalis TaxID=156871 RepID=MLP1_RANAR|nr:RecName: Full=Melittin-related peptide FQ-22-1 [Rana arvalis]